MSTSELEPQRRAWLAWEWRAALITVVGGIVIACAIAAYFTFRKPTVPTGLTASQVATAAMAQVVCRQALAGAKSFGIVPNYAQLASPYPTTTRVRGRYECVSGTNVARYSIAVDLVCKQINQQRCVMLYSVTQQDGTMLYRRRG